MQDHTPKSTEDVLYIPSSYLMVLRELLDRVEEHFGNYIDFEELSIEAEKIHTRCVTYDLYDPSDWDDYIVIRKLS